MSSEAELANESSAEHKALCNKEKLGGEHAINCHPIHTGMKSFAVTKGRELDLFCDKIF